MISILKLLLEYDNERRQIKTEALLLDESPVNTVEDALGLLISVSTKVFGTNEKVVSREIGELTRFRTIFYLLPELLLFGEPPIEKKPIIIEHLNSLGIEPDPDLVSSIKCICDHYRSKKNNKRKMGISDVYIKFPHVYRRIMDKQGSRCCYCGIQLLYGENAELDHVWPYHLGDDPSDGSNWCFSCPKCNQGKGEYPYYSLTSSVSNWIRPSSNGKLSSATRFAALSRDRSCKLCGKGPTSTELTVRKKVITGCWILDNIETICSMCSSSN